MSSPFRVPVRSFSNPRPLPSDIMEKPDYLEYDPEKEEKEMIFG